MTGFPVRKVSVSSVPAFHLRQARATEPARPGGSPTRDSQDSGQPATWLICLPSSNSTTVHHGHDQTADPLDSACLGKYQRACPSAHWLRSFRCLVEGSHGCNPSQMEAQPSRIPWGAARHEQTLVRRFEKHTNPLNQPALNLITFLWNLV
jgi:hypothetical protein